MTPSYRYLTKSLNMTPSYNIYRSSVFGGQRFMTKSTVFSTCRHCLYFSFSTCDRCVIFCETHFVAKGYDPLLSTLGRLSRNFGSSRYCFLFDAEVGGCVQSKCVSQKITQRSHVEANTVAKLNFVYYIIAQNLKYSFNKVNTNIPV
jgi:hypothetical protein